MKLAKPWPVLAVFVGVTLIGAATAALGAFAILGTWLVAAIGGGVLGGLTTLLAVGISGAARAASDPVAVPGLDQVTGLPSIETLRRDIEAVVRSGERHLLCVYALDGLKRYNDAYGQQCGDALLAWLARRMSEVVADRGSVYRLPGGSFAVLAPGEENATAEVRSDASGALFEVGDGFVIWALSSEVVLPLEASDAAAALELADRRARPLATPPRAESEIQPPSDPIEVLSPVRSRYDAGELARRIAGRMGLGPSELDDVEAATELRDAGNMAIPSAVLTQAGSLPDYEWRFIRLHTVVGERILASRFGMEAAGRLVRSCHERWDGGGYPEGLHGEAIPLGARIVFVCGAFADMTAERPHRRGLSPEAAMAELERAAGTQFDPEVVRSFRAAFQADRDLVRGERALRTRRPLRVLLVEPEPVQRFLLRRSIEAAGHECVSVPDGLSALETYRRALPGVVIAELAMTPLDGTELCRRIRAEGPGEAHVVMLVEAETLAERRAGLRADADGILTKPVARIDLEMTLSRAAATRRQASSA